MIYRQIRSSAAADAYGLRDMFPFLRRSAGIGRLASLWIHARLSNAGAAKSICVRCVSRDPNKRRTRWRRYRLADHLPHLLGGEKTRRAAHITSANHLAPITVPLAINGCAWRSIRNRVCKRVTRLPISCSAAIISLNLFIIRQIVNVHHHPPLEGVLWFISSRQIISYGDEVAQSSRALKKK